MAPQWKGAVIMGRKRGSGGRRYGDPRKRRPVAGDLARLVQPSGNANPRRLGGTMVDTDPHARGAVFIDLTDAVLLDYAEVCTVDMVRRGSLNGQAIFLTMRGRINKTDDRVQVGYLLNTDGAAALITEILALADRFGAEMLDDVTRRLTELHQGKDVDLAWLRAAIDNAIELAGELSAAAGTRDGDGS